MILFKFLELHTFFNWFISFAIFSSKKTSFLKVLCLICFVKCALNSSFLVLSFDWIKREMAFGVNSISADESKKLLLSSSFTNLSLREPLKI